MQNKGLMLGLILFIAVFAVFGNVPSLLAQNNSNDSDNDDDSDVSVNASVNVTVGDDDDDSDDDSDDEKETEDEDDEKERDRTRIRTRETIRDGNCTIKVRTEIKIENGKRTEVIKREMVCEDGTRTEVKIRIENRTVNGEIRERIKYEIKGNDVDIEAENEIDLEEETSGTEYKLKARLRNGNVTDIKIMPDTASEIALERLRALNFTIQLRERLDNRNIPRVVYNIETNQNGRFLGVFKIALRANAEVDPETGELLEVNTPWWAFLVTGEDDTTDDDNGNKTDTNQTETNDTNINDTFLENSTDADTNDTNNTAA